MSAPDLTKKVIGFRRWDLVNAHAADAPQTGALFSTFGGQTWGRGVNKATCAACQNVNPFVGHLWGSRPQNYEPPKPCETSPGPCGNCGLYALHAVPGELTQAQGPFERPAAQGVLGVVAAWGKLEVHRNGFRAEFAEIVALGYVEAWPVPWVAQVELAARAYDVPHLPGKELEQYALMVGERVPESLMPRPAPKPKFRDDLALMERKLESLENQTREYDKLQRKRRRLFG